MLVVEATFYHGTQSIQQKLYEVIPRIGEVVYLVFDTGEPEAYKITSVKWLNLGGHSSGNVRAEFDVVKA